MPRALAQADLWVLTLGQQNRKTPLHGEAYLGSRMYRSVSALGDPTRRGVLLRLMSEPGLSGSAFAEASRNDEASG
jgi:hypothetical protein